jgi:hypothetical protein
MFQALRKQLLVLAATSLLKPRLDEHGRKNEERSDRDQGGRLV